MKYLLLCSLLINNCTFSMLTTDVTSKTDNELYRYLYKKEIARTLPYEICKKIDILYAQLKNIGRKGTFIKSVAGPWENHRYDQEKTHLMISNDGHHFVHMLSNYPKLMHTEDRSHIHNIYSGYRDSLQFSPNNKYYLAKGDDQTGFFDLTQQKNLILFTKKETPCFGITISNDSQHILCEGRHHAQQPNPIYLLWSLDEQGKPKRTPLKNDLYHAMATIFHPDNKHIIHNQHRDELCLYNIATTEDIIISPTRDEKVFCLDTFTLTPDNKTIVAKTAPKDLNAQPDYILFNIENINKVTAITLPSQSCHKNADLPILSIPHKKIVTHITNKGRTLQLIDHNAQLLASYNAGKDTYITALAVDTTGLHLAVGYVDGTIIIWNLFSSNPQYCDKTCMRSYDPITSLTFTDNQLLFSQSHAQEPTSLLGNATLWDVNGNEIMDFGFNIIDSIISPNGKTINVVSTALEWHPEQASLCKHRFELTTYHQNDEVLAQYSNHVPSVAQLSRLVAEKYTK
jgi:WD40 repeat protein